MARSPKVPGLSRRQTEIMDVVYRLEEASVSEIQEQLHEPPTDGALRRMLHILAERGLVEARYDGPRKVYRPVQKKEEARRRALGRVAETFFGGSHARLMASLFEESDMELSDAERKTLRRLIAKAKEAEE
ncbi:MAG: BlaI/MecI/CopY family transcriptional regulator [Gemmatimonadota bacterium]|nr:MAG: BlaI/MecI/CopY family transcriptional regulator [Gemmatimonadota bacterium]